LKTIRPISHKFDSIVKPILFSHLRLQGAWNENEKRTTTLVQFSDLEEVVDKLSSMSILPIVKTLDFIPAFYKQGLVNETLLITEVIDLLKLKLMK